MKTRYKKPTRSAVDREYDKAIAFLVKKTKQWGYTVELARQFSKRTGQNVYRQVIDTWLHKDTTKRAHPSYGTVVVLLMAAEDSDKVFAEKLKEKAG